MADAAPNDATRNDAAAEGAPMYRADVLQNNARQPLA